MIGHRTYSAEETGPKRMQHEASVVATACAKLPDIGDAAPLYSVSQLARQLGVTARSAPVPRASIRIATAPGWC
jgi:hypothetical protein